MQSIYSIGVMYLGGFLFFGRRQVRAGGPGRFIADIQLPGIKIHISSKAFTCSFNKIGTANSVGGHFEAGVYPQAAVGRET